MLSSIASGIGLTLIITATSLVIGGILAIPLAVARRSRQRWLRGFVTTYVNLVRAIPPITWLFLIYFGLPQYALRLDTTTAAIVGFSIISSAYMAEAYRAGLLSIPAGQWEASTALGMRMFDTARHVITPQAFRVILPVIAAFAIALLKDSALASTIGVHDITYQAGLAAKRTHEGMLAFCIAGLLYIAISLPLALVTRRLSQSLRARVGVL